MDEVFHRPTCHFRETCSVVVSFILTALGFVFVVVESKPARGYVGVIFLVFMFGWSALLILTYLCCRKTSNPETSEDGTIPTDSTEYCVALVESNIPQRYIASLIPVAPNIPHLPRLRQTVAEDKPPDYDQLEFSTVEIESSDSNQDDNVPPPAYEDVTGFS